MCLSQIVGLDELYSRVLGINAILFYEIAKGNFSVCHSLFMIFIGLVDLGRARATWRGGAVAPLVYGLGAVCEWLLCFYVRRVGLV